MPQLDIYAFFLTTTALVLIFLILLFCLHTYILPKLAQCLKNSKNYILNVINILNSKINKNLNKFFFNLRSNMHLNLTIAGIFFVPILNFSYFLKMYSIISLACSSLYLLLSLLIIAPAELIFIDKVKKSLAIAKLFFIMLLIARWYCQLPKREYYFIGIISSMVLAGSTYVRICLSSGAVQPNTNIYYISIIILYLWSLANTFFRISVSLGSRIDQRGSAIDFIGPETWDKIIKGGFNLGETYWNRPIPPGAPQPDFLKKTGLVIGGCTLIVVGFTANEVYKTRVATQRSADIGEVANGLMTPAEYHKRWPKKQ